MTTPEAADLLLANLRVVDLADGKGEMCGRILADLGADVVRVEPLAGARSRRAQPTEAGDSLRFHVHNANKRLHSVDWDRPDGRAQLLALIEQADILIESEAPGRLARAGLSAEVLHEHNPRLVITSITDFGQSGPYRDWAATDWTHMALNSVLSRSGTPGDPPLMPPGRLIDETASMQAAWVTLAALWVAQETGRGDHIDVSVLEASLQTMDPAFGIAGSATGGIPASDLPPGRPDARHMYPIFACADGYVRICVLAKRQWRGMFTWLGEPPEFADPKWDVLGVRFAERATLYPYIARLFSDQTRGDLVAAGQRLGIPIEGVRRPGEVLGNLHFRERQAFTPTVLPGGATGLMPNGLVEIDGRRAGIRHPATPTEGAVSWRRSAAPPASSRDQPVAGRPALTGLRVLDLGVIVVGAETGRLFADLGADVIKIESRAFPDGSRQSMLPGPISPSFVWGHRNKRSLGLDLRSPEGKDLFLQLVAVSDVVLSNFKPGTMESLGLGLDVLQQINPGIVMVDSSAMGRTGQDSRRMGYGPLVRAATGLTSLWRYPERDDGFCDSITVYPDHTAARIGAVAALAKLIARRSTGRGGTVSVAQAEVMLGQFAPELLRESIHPGSMSAAGNVGEFDAPYGLYPCAGEDQWAVITVRGDDDWRSLCDAIGAPDLAADDTLAAAAGRVAARARIDQRIRDWTSTRSPHQVMTILQQAGVPAAAMKRVNDLLVDEHLVARKFYLTMHQPHIGDMPAERGPAEFSTLPQALSGRAPLPGEHTREVAEQVLRLSDGDIDKLVDRGILEPYRMPSD